MDLRGSTPTDHSPRTRPAWLRAGDELLAGAAAAVLGAALLLIWVRVVPIQFAVYEWDWRSVGLLWKAPWGYLLTWAPIAIGLAVAAVAAPRVLTLRVSLTIWLTLILWSVAVLYPQVHGWASLLLCVAIATQIAAWPARRPAKTRRALRYAGLVLLLAGLGTRPAVTGILRWAEARGLAALPSPAPGMPNILLLVWDTVRAESLSLYGASAPTSPRLEELARRGVTYDQAWATSPWTLPSHAAMFTGRYASPSATDFRAPLPGDIPVLAEALRDRGYATGGFTANLIATRAESGLARGFHRYEDFTSSLHEIFRSTPLTQADLVVVMLDILRHRRWYRLWPELRNGNFENNFTVVSHDVKRAPALRQDFLRWRDGLPAGRPWFGFINLFDAHDPYRPPPEHQAAVTDSVRSAVDRYHGSIRFVDHEVGLLLDELERRGDLSRTIVVVTSDHGEQFGEHGLHVHGNSLYRQVLQIPMVISYPGAPPGGVRVAEPVSLRDLPATLLSLAGIPPVETGIEGRPLLGRHAGDPTDPSDVLSEVAHHYRRNPEFRNRSGPMVSLVTWPWHVIRDGENRVELFRLDTDPAEEHDLSGSGSADALAATLDTAAARAGLGQTGRYRRATPPPGGE